MVSEHPRPKISRTGVKAVATIKNTKNGDPIALHGFPRERW
jgi:hypothetical protein